MLSIAALTLFGWTLTGVWLLQSCGGTTHHTVSLRWRPPVAGVGRKLAGYNVYRSVTGGGPYARIVSGLHDPSYTDSQVMSKSTYFYVVTAVDDVGRESRFSDEVEATIP